MIASIIFDWNQTLYNPESEQLLPGAIELLIFLKREEIPLLLIENANADVLGQVQNLGVTDYFTKIIFSAKQKTVEIFKDFMSINPKDTWVVGDSEKEELRIGNLLGATTVQVKSKKIFRQ